MHLYLSANWDRRLPSESEENQHSMGVMGRKFRHRNLTSEFPYIASSREFDPYGKSARSQKSRRMAFLVEEEWSHRKRGMACLLQKASGKARISHDEAVEDALCFGWIDGKRKRVDDERFIQRFTPRKPGSRWSAINIERAKRLIADNKMTSNGAAAFHPERKIKAHPTDLPDPLREEFQCHSERVEDFPRLSVLLPAHDHCLGGNRQKEGHAEQAPARIDSIFV